MTTKTDRVAFAVAVDDGLALGDPTASHVVLSADGVEHRRGEQATTTRFAWAEVRAVTFDAPASRSRRPAAMAVGLAMAAQSIGLDWTPGIAPVTLTVEDDEGPHAFECDGYVGPGYWRPHLDVLDAGLHVLTTHPQARTRLARPTQVLADVGAAAGLDPRAARARLAHSWDTTCTCD